MKLLPHSPMWFICRLCCKVFAFEDVSGEERRADEVQKDF